MLSIAPQRMFSPNGKKSIAVVGLDNSGKSSIISRLKNSNRPLKSTVKPTELVSRERVQLGGQKIVLSDLGGCLLARACWRKEVFMSSAIVFVIDTLDCNRVSEAVEALHELYDSGVDPEIPLLILCNKYEGKNSLSLDAIYERLQLDTLSVHHCMVLPCSAKYGLNLDVAMAWIMRQLRR